MDIGFPNLPEYGAVAVLHGIQVLCGELVMLPASFQMAAGPLKVLAASEVRRV